MTDPREKDQGKGNRQILRLLNKRQKEKRDLEESEEDNEDDEERDPACPKACLPIEGLFQLLEEKFNPLTG